MTADWGDRPGYDRDGRRQEEDRNYSRHSRNRDWSDRAGDEEAGRRSSEDRRYEQGRGGPGRYDGGRDYSAAMRPFSGSGPRPGYDRPWQDDMEGGMDRDVYGYPSRQSDDQWAVPREQRSQSYRSPRPDRYGDDRGFMDKAGDEVASWFGDEDAQRRRQMDHDHRGRGPKNYTRSDERIAEDVNDRLSDDRHIDASGVEVSVSGGEVTLDGTVSERFAKRHAEDIAESVSGVTHVQNNLRLAKPDESIAFGSTSADGGQRPQTSSASSASARH